MLLDIAKEMVVDEGPSSVSMGSVADRAGVTRALVYKHFENKDVLLAELFRREARALDAQIRQVVDAAADGFELKLRAFVGACLDASGTHGRFFAPLRGVGRDRSARDQQRRWDRRTVEYFATLATEEFDLDARTATSAIRVLFSGIQTLLSQMNRGPGTEQRRFLEDTYVDMALGALDRLSR